MTDPHKLTVASMPDAFVAEDGSIVEVEFANAAGEAVRLSFNAHQFEAFSSRAIQLFTHARNESAATSGHRGIHAVEAVAAMAQAATGMGKVILALKGEKGLIFHFALAPEVAEALRPHLFRAAKSARKQASQPRH